MPRGRGGRGLQTFDDGVPASPSRGRSFRNDGYRGQAVATSDGGCRLRAAHRIRHTLARLGASIRAASGSRRWPGPMAS